MEYLREDVKEKEDDTATILLGGNSDEAETSTQDVEVSPTKEAWLEQDEKVSWVDRIKTIGQYVTLRLRFTN